MYVPAYNVTDTAVVIDSEGRTLGGGEWGAVDRHDPVAQAAIGDSRLVIHPDLDASAADVDQAAIDAHDEAATLEGRRVELANRSGDQLYTLAAAAGFIADRAPDAGPLSDDEVDDLRRRLARTDVPLTGGPAPAAAPEPDAEPPKKPARGGVK